MPVEKEIRSQLEVLPKVLDWYDELPKEEIAKIFRETEGVIFLGCGSSYYIALSAARFFMKKLGKPAWAVPAGEVIVAREWSVPPLDDHVAIFISRSGETSEVLKAVKILKSEGVRTIGVTLKKSSSLFKAVDLPIALPYDERSIVMTRSFSGMLLALELISEDASGNPSFGVYEKLIGDLPDTFERFEKLSEKLSDGKHYVFLGSGPYEGIARESALKLQEMSLTTTEAYSTLEYRHGPKSLVEPGVVVILYGGGDHERKLSEEVDEMGGRSEVIESKVQGYEDMFAMVMFAQLLGLKIAKKKGVDVENPRNLTKVVKL